MTNSRSIYRPALGAAAALAVLVAVVTVDVRSHNAPSTHAPLQRMAITSTPGPVERFVLKLSSAGSVMRDSGTVTYSEEDEATYTREGQRVRTWSGTGLYVGNRGTFSLGFRTDWVNVGRNYEAAQGSWSWFPSGTGAYKNLNGAGLTAGVWSPGGLSAFRADGFVRADGAAPEGLRFQGVTRSRTVIPPVCASSWSAGTRRSRASIAGGSGWQGGMWTRSRTLRRASS